MLVFSIITVGQGLTTNAITQTSITQSKTQNTSSITYNNEHVSVTILNDNANSREVKVTNGNKVSIVTYNKNTNTAALNGTTKIDFNEKKKFFSNSYIADSNSDLKNNYSYDVLTYGGLWLVEDQGARKCVRETMVNPNTNEVDSVPLKSFRTSVNSLKGYQIGACTAYGTAVLALIAGLINTPDTLAFLI
ncbi:MAG: geobacillin-26 family protein [Clostridium sp.]|nr:geobacillin-26 family protein [Clostridium sp.]